jgi:hypothetical protein
MGGGHDFLLAHKNEDFRAPEFDPAVFDEVIKEVRIDTASHRKLLERENGFYAFDRSLHIFGACMEPGFHSLRVWNDPAGWRREYEDMADGCVFFAEDPLGDQYAYYEDGICRFTIETAEKTMVAATFDGWVEWLRTDLPVTTGCKLAVRWEQMNGRKRTFGTHLAAGQLFILGGEYEPDHLEEVDQFQNAGWKAWLANQIRDLPDGTEIRLEFE